jgi:peptidyl-tRNA hydrolase, PTH1 family
VKLIIGLGNPGSKYQQTRHNVGFMVLDQYANDLKQTFKYDNKFNAEVFITNIFQEKVMFVKPSTYMNLSGEAVIKIMKYYDVDIDDILVFVDDINLDTGRLRLRAFGGHGGHNGLKNIIGLCHSNEFKRVRIGVSNNSNMALDHYVLSQFGKQEMIEISIAIEKSKDIINQYIKGVPFTDIMTTFNTQT